ncbi:hypothetical protein GH733_015784 [Mirounga leonina]|nr:hypothetical protein GH733_015784 [Mirounga leonina]
MYMEGRIKAPGAQPSLDMSATSKRSGAEPTMSGVRQVEFPDAAGMDSGKPPSSSPGGPEKGPRHRESSEEGPLELRTQEQVHPAGPRKKQSTPAPQEGPRELQAGRSPAKPGSELGVLTSRVPAAHEGKETEDQQGRQQNPGMAKGQALQSHQGPECQPTPGHQAAHGADMVQPVAISCTLDSCGQPQGGKLPKEVDTPHIRPQEDSSQEAVHLMPLATPEENTANSFPPSTPGPDPPKGRVKAVETQPAPGPVPPPELRGIGERRDLDPVLKQPREPTVAAGAQNLRQGFMKCLLEVEEEEATHRRAAKARALPNRKSPRTLTPVPTSAPSLPQNPASAPAMAPSWALLPAPGPVPAPTPVGSPVPASGPGTALPAPTLDVGWRRAELLHLSGERSLSSPKTRQELEERRLLKLDQNWDERFEEHLTLRQEEGEGRPVRGSPSHGRSLTQSWAFRSYFEIFNGHGEVNAQSLGNILLLVGISLTPAQDFLAVMTDTRRFFCSVEQNALTDMAPPNPHTLLFEILSLLVEMLALPEAALEEITNYYQKKLKEGTCKAREMELAIGRLRSRKKLPYNPQQSDLEVPERRVLRILSRLKQQNYGEGLGHGEHSALLPPWPLSLGPRPRS